jgi:hypothetical protein
MDVPLVPADVPPALLEELHPAAKSNKININILLIFFLDYCFVEQN